MKQCFAISSVALVLFLPGTADYQAAIPHFNTLRRIAIYAPDRQNYIVVDENLWAHARPDLADIRLYDGTTQVAYVLKEQRGSVSTVEQPAKIVNLGAVKGNTEFDLDVGAIPEYDHIQLRLDTKNFVATAQISGRQELSAPEGVELGKSTLYDFTRENLGSNFVIKISAASFPFLHIRLTTGIRPDEVKGALISNVQEEKAAWTNAGLCQPETSSQTKTSVLVCQFPASVPVDRIVFQIPPQRVNFRRAVRVQDSTGSDVANGEISRVRIQREGREVVSESLTLDLPDVKQKQLRVIVENGDDPPLSFNAVTPLSIQRRIYFDPSGRTLLTLYSGDDKLTAPSYDYAKFFHQDPAAAQAQLEPSDHNPEYAGRPDDRPWSERHKGVLWAAMILAVVALALLAIRGFATSEKYNKSQ